MFEIINEVGFGKGPHAKLTRGQASTRFMMCFTYIKCFSWSYNLAGADFRDPFKDEQNFPSALLPLVNLHRVGPHELDSLYAYAVCL